MVVNVVYIVSYGVSLIGSCSLLLFDHLKYRMIGKSLNLWFILHALYTAYWLTFCWTVNISLVCFHNLSQKPQRSKGPMMLKGPEKFSPFEIALDTVELLGLIYIVVLEIHKIEIFKSWKYFMFLLTYIKLLKILHYSLYLHKVLLTRIHLCSINPFIKDMYKIKFL